MDIGLLRPIGLDLAQVDGQFERGRTRPLLTVCEDADGRRRQFVLKLRDPGVGTEKPWHSCLARELIGSSFARALGFTVPDYGIVEISEETVQAHSRSRWGPLLEKNKGPNLGVELAEAAVDLPPNYSGDEGEWRDLLNFDALLWNGDRMGANPNALLANDQLILIDHGMVIPSWTFELGNIDGSSVWERVDAGTHLAFSRLRGRRVDFSLGEAWKVLDVAAIVSMLGDVIPDSWSDTADCAEWNDFVDRRSQVADSLGTALRGMLNDS